MIHKENMSKFLKLTVLFIACIITGCAHKIYTVPRKINIPNYNPSITLETNVGYYIAPEDKFKEVITPGGGGDKVKYTPYKDNEDALKVLLDAVFGSVYQVESLNDQEFIKNQHISYIFKPSITTNSFSRSYVYWPPTSFTFELTLTVIDSNNNHVWNKTVNAEGISEWEKLKNNWSLSAILASERAYQLMASELLKSDFYLTELTKRDKKIADAQEAKRIRDIARKNKAEEARKVEEIARAKKAEETNRMKQLATLEKSKKMAERAEAERARRALEMAEAEEIRRIKNQPKLSATGTGFVVAKQGYIATNYHVIKDCKIIQVGNSEAEIIGIDAVNDLALIKTNETYSRSATLSFGAVKLSDDISIYGYPLSGLFGDNISVTEGIVSALSGIHGDHGKFRITAPIQPGNSGGPIINNVGQVIGVVVSTLDNIYLQEVAGIQSQNVNFGIRVSLLINMLESKNIPVNEEKNKNLDINHFSKITKLLNCYK
jgi:S1-C subfamily serine protease